MPIYTYRCSLCGTTGEIIKTFACADDPVRCPNPGCDTCMKRVPSLFSSRLPMPDHYNASLGTHVRSESHFKDILKAQSDEATARTGIPHNYVMHDPREAKDALGVTDEGLEATHKQMHDEAARHAVVVADPDRRHIDQRQESTPSTSEVYKWL